MIFHETDWKDASYETLDMPESGSTCVVGLSGGVDSALAAMILKEKGCRVIGVTMSKWTGDLDLPSGVEGMKGSCYGPDEEKDIAACKVFCAEQGFEYHVIPVGEAYHREVLEYFKDEYRAGRTPNPCIRCNPLVKFGAMIEGVRALGIQFDYFCTGHYARIVKNAEGGLFIQSAEDSTKDQTYFLYRLPQETLAFVRFPLGSYEKKDVVTMARERNLAAAGRAESQDFVPPEYFDVIFSDKPPVPGDIVDLDGKKLGTHRGIEYYTIGQRRGLGVSSSRPLYVHSIDATNNRVVLADNDDLLEAGLVAGDWVWGGGAAPKEAFSALVKIRLASRPVEATIAPVKADEASVGDTASESGLSSGGASESGLWEIRFENKQRAVAPGQSAVVYYKGIILGGGIISRAIHE